VRLAAEDRPQQPIDLVPHRLAWQTVAELEFDETDEQRIERAPGGQELLSDIREWLGTGDHAGERADLAGRALGVANGSRSLIDGTE
jgi:hypothetical protein